jgi:hypothetical protein
VLELLEVLVGGHDACHGRVLPQIVQGRFALHAYAQKKYFHFQPRCKDSKKYYT